MFLEGHIRLVFFYRVNLIVAYLLNASTKTQKLSFQKLRLGSC